MIEQKEPTPKELSAAAARVLQVQEIRAAQERESRRRALLTRDDIREQFRAWIDADTYAFGDASDFVRDCPCIPAEERETFIRGTYAELTGGTKPVQPRYVAPRPEEEEEEEEDDEEEPTEDDAAEPETEDEDAVVGIPFLLPIGGMPGYSVDIYGLPHANKRRGTKGGPIKPDRFWRRREGRKPEFICGFRVRLDGIQKRYRGDYFQMARNIAEQKYQNRALAS
jgi:hypothetical protein